MFSFQLIQDIVLQLKARAWEPFEVELNCIVLTWENQVFIIRLLIFWSGMMSLW